MLIKRLGNITISAAMKLIHKMSTKKALRPFLPSELSEVRAYLFMQFSSMIPALAISLRPIHPVKSSIAPSHSSPNTGENAVETWPPIEHGRERCPHAGQSARNWMEMSSNSKGSANLPFGAVRKAVAHHTGAPPIQPLISVPIIVLNVSGKLFFVFWSDYLSSLIRAR